MQIGTRKDNDNQIKSGKENPNAARINPMVAGHILGFDDEEIRYLANTPSKKRKKEKILPPLGNPAPNAMKYFSRCFVESLVLNEEWLSEATQAIYDYHKNKNAKKIPAQGGEVVASFTA